MIIRFFFILLVIPIKIMLVTVRVAYGIITQ